MTVYTEGNYTGDLLKYELNPLYTRETVTLVSGQNLTVGAVLGQITTGGKYTILAPGASDGSQTVAGVLLFDCNASSADTKAVILKRGPAVVSADYLVWPAGISAPNKATAIAALTALGIVQRAAY